MKFSILIAYYNNYRYFKACYDSILMQTYQNYEIIIVDDKSTDGSLDEVKILTQNNPRVFIHENSENKGVGYTKRKCVEVATGEICGFVDPDDKIIESAVEDSINAYTKNVVATYSQLYECDENLNIKHIFPNTKKISPKNYMFFNVRFEIAHFFTFKREAYLQTSGINENYLTAEDQDLILKIYEIGPILFIPKALYLYRVHSKGLSHNRKKMSIKKQNWHDAIRCALQRRGIEMLYGQEVKTIINLPDFIFKKQNTILNSILRKFR